MEERKMKKLFIICELFIATATLTYAGNNAPADTSIQKEKLEFSCLVSIGSTQWAPRVGKIIGPLNPSIDIFPLISHRGWYVWLYKTWDVVDYRQPGNYAQVTIGKKINAGKFSFDINMASFWPQNQSVFDYQTFVWIPNVIIVYRATEKSLFKIWVNRFEPVGRIGSNWNQNVSYGRKTSFGNFKITLWYNSGVFETTPGLNTAMSVKLNPVQVGKNIKIVSQITGVLNLTRDKENLFTQDGIILHLFFPFGG